MDITLPGRTPVLGYRHPLSLVREQVQEIFTRLGYQVLEGPEIEDDYHNFEALNMPAEHPARDMQDTLYLAEPLTPGAYRPPTRGRAPTAPQPLTLLRTHTSAMQIRHMEQHDPPVRLVAIGPVYRRDNLDLTHTPMFHQVEGLVVGAGITLADLKGTLTSMARALFGEGQEVRFRPSFFPYTEPSAEVDIRCIRCRGAGCAICKRTGWLEILGSGMVHPVVFEYVGYDPDKVTGFAFGMGIERVALLKWDVEDIRLFYENDCASCRSSVRGRAEGCCEGCPFVDPRVRRRAGHAGRDRRAHVAARPRARRHRAPRRRGGARFRRHRQPAGLPVDDRHRARDCDGLRAAAEGDRLG